MSRKSFNVLVFGGLTTVAATAVTAIVTGDAVATGAVAGVWAVTCRALPSLGRGRSS